MERGEIRVVRQHVYRVSVVGGHTVAAGGRLLGSAWLPLLEEQLRLIDFDGLTFPVYYQYPMGAATVLTRYEPNPVVGGGTARQLIFDDAADIQKLLGMRPLCVEAFRAAIETDGMIEDIEIDRLDAETGAAECFYALDRYFAGEEELLVRMLGALSLCARDKRLTLRVLLDGTAAEISENGRRLMELMLRGLSPEDAQRLSFCTCLRPDGAGMRFSVGFCADDAQSYGDGAEEILLNLAKRSMFLPMGVSLAESARDREAAQALLEHDLMRLDRVKSGVKASRPTAEKVRPESFERGMSLKTYFESWRRGLSASRELLNEEGFRARAAGEWKRLLNAVVAASELMENVNFLTELNGILSVIRKERLEETLALDGETTTDLIVLLLDSIQWRQIELAKPQTGRLMRAVTAYAQVLDDTQCDPACLTACRVIHRLLTAPAFVQESLTDMAFLGETAPGRFDAVQDCLKQYVHNRMVSDIDVIDEAFAAATALGFVRFSDGVPDLRLADKLAEHLDAKIGGKAAKRFQHMMDKLRSNLHSRRSGWFRWKDMKLLIFISCLLLMLIAAISLWFVIAY